MKYALICKKSLYLLAMVLFIRIQAAPQGTHKTYPVNFKPISFNGRYIKTTLSGGVKNVFYSKNPVDLTFKISHLTPGIINFISCELKDSNKKVVWENERRVEIPSPKHPAYINVAYRDVIEKFGFELEKNGAYELTVRLKDSNKAKILEELKFKLYAIMNGNNRNKIEDSFWGIRSPAIDIDLTWMMGIKWISAEIAWPWVEPEKGMNCFKVVDDAIQKYKDTGFCIMPILNKTAPWAIRTDVPKSGELTPPQDLNEWGNYVYKTVGRYKYKYWSVWEEPDCGWKRPINEYIDLLKKAYEESKKANPESKIIGGNPGRLTQGIGNLQFYLENGLSKCCDIIGIHPYVAPRSPEAGNWDGEFENLNKLIKKYGKKEIWATEVGWSTGKGGCSVTDKQQADYLVRMYLLGLSTPNLERIFWFCGSPYGVEDRWGIIEKDKNGFLHPRPALIAFSALTSLLEGFHFDKKVFPKDITAKRTRSYFYRKDQKTTVALWRTGVQTTLEVEAFKIEGMFDINGNALNPPTPEKGKIIFTVGESPIYIKLAKNKNIDTVAEKFKNAAAARVKSEHLSPLLIKMLPLDCGLNKLKYISFDIFNQSPEKKNAKIELTELPEKWKFSTNELSFDINEEQSKQFRFYIKNLSRSPFNEYKFSVKNSMLNEDFSKEEKFYLDFQVCKHTKKPIEIDGDLNEWEEFYPVHIGCHKWQMSYLKNNYGKTDLKGVAYTAWDDKYFYFACRVTDDVFYNQKGIIYSRDCIQIAFDTKGNAQRAGYDSDDFEFSLARGKKGDEVFSSWQGKKAGRREFLTEKISGIKFKTKLIERMAPRPQEIIYEMAIPLKFLGLNPQKCKKFGFEIVIMDNDNVFKGGAEYKGGIIGSKNPARFAKWTFIKE